MEIELLKEAKIGEKMTVGASYNEDEIGVFVASEDISTSIAFRPKEFEKFVAAILEIDRRLAKHVRG